MTAATNTRVRQIATPHGWMLRCSIPPWGIVVCLTLAFVAAVTMRAWSGFVPLAGYALGLVVTVLVLTQSGPGGDTLVPDGQAIGWVWLLGSAAATVVVALLPRGLFDDRPRAPRATAVDHELVDPPS